MFVGVLRLHLSIVGARSLKDKRSVVRSFKERAQARLRVSVAEIGVLDHPQHATIGVAVVSNSAAQCNSVLESVTSMASTLSEALLTDRASEVIPFGEGGTGIQGGIEQAFASLHGDDDAYDDDDDGKAGSG